MLIENIIGVDLNAPEKRIDWTIRLTEAHLPKLQQKKVCPVR
jgi:hypothetical protein